MKAVKAVLICGGLAIYLVALSPAAHAQSDTAVLRSQIELLRANLGTLSKQFQELQQYVFTNRGAEAGAGNAATSANSPSAAANDITSQRLAVVESRLDQIDQNKLRKV